MDDNKYLEDLWSQLLSREAEQVRQAFATLAPEEQQAVRLHLQRMATEEGWHPEQRLSAEAALKSLGD